MPGDVSSCLGEIQSHSLSTILCAKVSMEKLAMDMESEFKTKGRMDAWTRMDLHSETYKTTNRERPTWRDVANIVNPSARSGDITNIEDATNINRDTEHRLVEGGLCDLVTALLLIGHSAHTLRVYFAIHMFFVYFVFECFCAKIRLSSEHSPLSHLQLASQFPVHFLVQTCCAFHLITDMMRHS